MKVTAALMDDWKAALTADFPREANNELTTLSDIPGHYKFLLTTHVDGHQILSHSGYFAFVNRESRDGSLGTFANPMGYAGIGAIYMRNLALLARDSLGFDMLRILAGDKRGAYVWAQCGFRAMPSHFRADEEDRLYEVMADRLDLVAACFSAEERHYAERLVENCKEDQYGFWALVDCGLVIDADWARATCHQDLRKLADHYHTGIPLAAFLTHCQQYPAVFDLHDGPHWDRLHERADLAIDRNLGIAAARLDGLRRKG